MRGIKELKAYLLTLILIFSSLIFITRSFSAEDASEEKPVSVLEKYTTPPAQPQESPGQEDDTAKPQPAVTEYVKPVPAASQPAAGNDDISISKNKDVAEAIDLRPGGNLVVDRAMETPLLKKIDINRIGASPYYEEFQGLRLAKYFSVAQRVEIYQEPRPIDAYIMDAKKIRYLHYNQPWNKPVLFRQQIVPIFTRSYGTEVTISDPNNKEGQLRYTFDHREIYQDQFPVYLLNPQSNRTDIPYSINTNYKHEIWDQHEILIMHARQVPGIDWYCTSNLGYRYSTMSAKNDGSTFSYYENRHTYFAYGSIAPNERLEFFGQFEYFKSMRVHSNFDYRPDHYLYATEVRMKSHDLKTSVIPRFSYSKDKYWPLYDRFHKYETQLRIGRDFTKKLNGTTTLKYQLALRNDVDNHAPTYARPNPQNDAAAWVGIENRGQYNVYDRLWLQGGLDFAAGTNMCDFDNIGFLAGLEYYAPGLIRIDFGYRGNAYYNIDDYLSSVYFKFYLFM